MGGQEKYGKSEEIGEGKESIEGRLCKGSIIGESEELAMGSELNVRDGWRIEGR